MCQNHTAADTGLSTVTPIVNHDHDDFGLCEHCDEPLLADDHITTNDGYTFCSASCAESSGYVQCCECGDWLDEDDCKAAPESRSVCEPCFDREGYYTCDDCGEAFYGDDVTWIEGEDRIVCGTCRRESYRLCHDCGNWHNSSDTRYIDGENYYVCDRCYDRNDYFYCENCDSTYSGHNYGGDGRCEDCYDDGSDHRIHDYSYRPSYKFFRSNEKDKASSNLYFGIELEVEIERGSLSDACDEVDGYSHLYMKQDGSIDHGFEIVSHPCTLNYWQENKEEFSGLLESLYKIGDAESQGLHVHISKSGMTDAHKIRFQSFFDANNQHLPTIARRDECQWAKYKELSHGQWKAAATNSDRYRAVNWLPSSTVEIRMFRGTLDINEFLASVEFCHAVYRFTKGHISLATIANGDSWTAFCSFLKFDKRYSHLAKYLKNKEIYKG